MTIVFACAIRARSSIRIGTPAAASGILTAARANAGGLVGDHLDVDARSLGTDWRPNDAGTDRQAIGADDDLMICPSASSIARAATAVQSSSGAKQTAMAAPVDTKPEGDLVMLSMPRAVKSRALVAGGSESGADFEPSDQLSGKRTASGQ
jgi:hypothetical protein